jgi:hypothetical protein
MKWSEIGLILLAVSAVAGLFTVVTGEQQIVEIDRDTPEETGPLRLLERDIAEVCYGSAFREVPSASPDTIVRSMDLLDTVSIHQANLYITRTLRNHGFDHVVTYSDPERGLSFICHTPDGEPLRFELYDIDR